MSVHKGIFGNGSCFNERRVDSYERLSDMVAMLKRLGLRVALTSGSFDLIHQGHAQYLEKARGFGDFLVVGVDSDAKIKQRKGPDRPVVPEDERLLMLSHLRHVDLVVLKPLLEERWALIRAVRPDVLIATEETYTPEQIAELEREYCGRVEILPRMAITTTTARLRELQIDFAAKFGALLSEQLPDLLREIMDHAIRSQKRGSDAAHDNKEHHAE